jgi:hypothetical protein
MQRPFVRLLNEETQRVRRDPSSPELTAEPVPDLRFTRRAEAHDVSDNVALSNDRPSDDGTIIENPGPVGVEPRTVMCGKRGQRISDWIALMFKEAFQVPRDHFTKHDHPKTIADRKVALPVFANPGVSEPDVRTVGEVPD